jgi:hypothetical protein
LPDVSVDGILCSSAAGDVPRRVTHRTEIEMALQATPRQQVRACSDRYAEGLRRRRRATDTDWVRLAGTLLPMLGTINLIKSIAAVGDSHFVT